MKILTKYQKKIVDIILKNGSFEVIKYPSDRFYLITFKRHKETKKLLRESVISMIIESSKSYVIDQEKGIFGLRFVNWMFEEYCKKNQIQIKK